MIWTPVDTTQIVEPSPVTWTNVNNQQVGWTNIYLAIVLWSNFFTWQQINNSQ